MNTKLKICGIRREEDILMVNSIKPQYIGFVFAKSKRQIDLKTAINLKSKLYPNIKSVGVFVDEPITNVIRAVESKAIDIVQLHGDESNLYISQIKSLVNVEVIKAIRINKEFNKNIDFSAADYLLIDSGKGSGKVFDWNISVNFNKPLFIAGGINIENIEDAFIKFKPFAFDLSSSVEENGVKNFDKMKEIHLKLESLNGEYYE
ncbi:MAG: phosphoribosylanthranilate isomerase [Sphaerochaetaceae bacterium]|nr:phosphoribosylanthranilate isomerase [Sphaerochaetaceae bacterium]